MKQNMHVLVVGASRGSGLETVKELLSQGHQVTAFSRKASDISLVSGRLEKLDGDAMNPQDIEQAVQGKDAVIVTLGISENPLRVRLLGAGRTPLRVRSEGTQQIIKAMRKFGVKRLIVQSSYGVGETRDLLNWSEKLLFSLLLAPQIQDTERQESAVRGSGLEWVLAQPVNLTDETLKEEPFVSLDGAVQGRQVSREQVARVLVQATVNDDFIGRSLSISG